MQRIMLKSKIHNATVTEANLDYIGSITIDEKLMELADILPGERVQVVDLTNGNRLETYVIIGEANSGAIEMNGPAAHLIKKGDTICIISYALLNNEESESIKPKVLFVNSKNQLTSIKE